MSTCPHCNYSDDFNLDDNGDYKRSDEYREYGDMFSLSVLFERREDYHRKEVRALKACPKCNKTFIDYC